MVAMSPSRNVAPPALVRTGMSAKSPSSRLRSLTRTRRSPPDVSTDPAGRSRLNMGDLPRHIVERQAVGLQGGQVDLHRDLAVRHAGDLHQRDVRVRHQLVL